ncbi:hypothetical protein Ae201684P_006800 [Aphanomyces euteiches]|uniref:Uncharacterized protein n=1 Tax=Aphanomyces euteiches TaxID=100861 RepID=A0A6G0X8K8_9STRA|nr:hypothetical protein Ae201684_007359 [Aphanomyces euteiches]KAH9100604.1 hypothetical protein Ae201684P_006800 [Aphanomyces euteiches]
MPRRLQELARVETLCCFFLEIATSDACQSGVAEGKTGAHRLVAFFFLFIIRCDATLHAVGSLCGPSLNRVQKKSLVRGGNAIMKTPEMLLDNHDKR